MAEAQLRDGEVTPIAQLNPDLPEQNSRIVSGVVTIIWPFSIVTKSIAFILAEPDFRLRRDKGQVRLRFHGAAAKAITDSGIGGGDEIRLSLNGVKWEKNEMQTQLAGSTLEWQLEFTNRVLVSIQRADEEVLRVVDIDVPEVEVNGGITQDIESVDRQPSNGDGNLLNTSPRSPELALPAKRPAISSLEPQEFESPAFVKRARVSYGSLFEGGFDIFDEKTSKKSKARRSTRFSLPANAWTYSSRSPSPAAEEESEQESQNGEAQDKGMNQPEEVAVTAVTAPQPRPTMVDEGCQTMDVDFTPMASVQVSAEARPNAIFPHATPTPLPRTRPSEIGHELLDNPLNFRNMDSPADFLAHSHGHMDSSLGYGLNVATSQPLQYPPRTDLFSAPRSEDAVPDQANRLVATEDYPPAFLDDAGMPSVAMDTHPSIHSHDGSLEPQPTGNPTLQFEPNPQFYPTFEEVPLQNSQSPWDAPQFAAVDSMDSPAEPIDSSPKRHSPADEPSSPVASASSGDMEAHQNEGMDNLDAESNSDDDTGASSVVEGLYEDGGDRPGDDYDLRNYDRAQADDDDGASLEEDLMPSSDDVEAQIIDPEEEEEDAEEEEEGYEDELDDHHYEDRQHGEFEDDEREYYSDEQGYSEEEEVTDEEEENIPPALSASKEPVFISLLSDSEDEDEDSSEPPLTREHETMRQPAQELTEPGLASEEQSDIKAEEEPRLASASESDSTSESENETGQDMPVEDGEDRNDEGQPLEAPEPVSEISNRELLAESIATDKPESRNESDYEEDNVVEETRQHNDEPAFVSGDHMDIDEHQPSEPLSIPQGSVADAQPALEAKAPSSPIQHEDTAINGPDTVHATVAESPSVSNRDDMEETGGDGVEEEPPIRDASQTVEEVRIERVEVIASGDAMEVDAPEEEQAQEHETQTGATLTVTETEQVIFEKIEEDVTDSNPKATEGIDVVQMSAVLSVTTEPDFENLTTRNDLQEETAQSQEITGMAPETRDDPTARSPEIGPLETFSSPPQVATNKEAGPSEEAQATLADQGEGEPEITNGGRQLKASPPISPPPTQSFQKEANEPLSPQISPSMSTQEKDLHLPTPLDTQPDAEMKEQNPPEQQSSSLGDEDDVGPYDQLMSEFLQHSPVRPESIEPTTPTKKGSSPAQRKASKLPSDEKAVEAGQGSDDKLITTKSLRSHGHRATRSSDLTKASQSDPSVLLAKSSAPPPLEDEATPGNSPQGTMRVTRSKHDATDPSVPLAKASADAEGIKSPESSPSTLRVTRSSKPDLSDPSIPLAKAKSKAKATTAPSTRSTRRQQTPEPIPRETRASSRGLPRGTTPETTLPAADLTSPSVASTVEDENVRSVKLQLTKHLRTELPEYPSLKTLRNWVSKTVDIIGVATAAPAQPQRPKRGPRDYMMSVNLIDPSAAPTTIVVAHLFRAHQQALPLIHTGDVVLLRRVNVVGMHGRDFGVRTGDASAWAVFERTNLEMLPQIKGPPVELNDEEVKHAELLKRWWNLLDDKTREKIDKANRKL